MNRTGWLGRISLAVDQMCEAEVCAGCEGADAAGIGGLVPHIRHSGG